MGKISAQPHTTLYSQFLDRENNNQNNTYTGEFLLFSYPYMELWRIR